MAVLDGGRGGSARAEGVPDRPVAPALAAASRVGGESARSAAADVWDLDLDLVQ